MPLGNQRKTQRAAAAQSSAGATQPKRAARPASKRWPPRRTGPPTRRAASSPRGPASPRATKPTPAAAKRPAKNMAGGSGAQEKGAPPPSRDPLETLLQLLSSKNEKIRLESAKITLPYFYDKPEENENSGRRAEFGGLPFAKEIASALARKLDQADPEAAAVPASDRGA